MSHNRIVFDGLVDFKTALRNLPEHLKGDAGEVVQDTAQAAATEVQQNYPTGPTGNLKRGVRRESGFSRFGASALVKSAAKHAHLFERGTRQRRTAKGANRGAMPEAPQSQQMIPAVIKHRRRMVERLKAIVRAAGFQVE